MAPEQEPGVRRMPPGEPPDQSRLADAGLARHQDDAAPRRHGGQCTAQLVEQRRTLQQVHRDATLSRAASTKVERDVPAEKPVPIEGLPELRCPRTPTRTRP